MTATLTARPAQAGTTAFSVQVVDGNGVEVSNQPVTARIDLGDGYERVMTTETDGWGQARFELAESARGVTVATGGELVQARAPIGALTIEM